MADLTAKVQCPWRRIASLRLMRGPPQSRQSKSPQRALRALRPV